MSFIIWKHGVVLIKKVFQKIQKLKKAGGLNEFDMPVMPKDNAQLEEFMSLLLE